MSTLTKLNHFDDLVDYLLSGDRKTSLPNKKSLIPAMNVRSTDDFFILDFELPGFEKDEIEIHLEDRNLVVKAEQKNISTTESEANSEPKDAKNMVWLRKEISTHRYERRVSIPENIDVSSIKAENQNGILTVTLPKVAKEDKLIKIKING
jgi:HSP20 family protein